MLVISYQYLTCSSRRSLSKFEANQSRWSFHDLMQHKLKTLQEGWTNRSVFTSVYFVPVFWRCYAEGINTKSAAPGGGAKQEVGTGVFIYLFWGKESHTNKEKYSRFENSRWLPQLIANSFNSAVLSNIELKICGNELKIVPLFMYS